MIVELGSRAVFITRDESTARYEAITVREMKLPTTGDPGEARRALVELRRFHGGTAPHALLGAEYVPGGETLVVRLLEGTPRKRRRTCCVQLSGRKLCPGVPSELVEPALSGLARTLDVGPGRVTVDRAAFDPVETSPLSVELTAELLGRVLSLECEAPTEAQLRGWLEALP